MFFIIDLTKQATLRALVSQISCLYDFPCTVVLVTKGRVVKDLNITISQFHASFGFSPCLVFVNRKGFSPGDLVYALVRKVKRKQSAASPVCGTLSFLHSQPNADTSVMCSILARALLDATQNSNNSSLHSWTLVTLSVAKFYLSFPKELRKLEQLVIDTSTEPNPQVEPEERLGQTA